MENLKSLKELNTISKERLVGRKGGVRKVGQRAVEITLGGVKSGRLLWGPPTCALWTARSVARGRPQNQDWVLGPLLFDMIVNVTSDIVVVERADEMERW